MTQKGGFLGSVVSLAVVAYAVIGVNRFVLSKPMPELPSDRNAEIRHCAEVMMVASALSDSQLKRFDAKSETAKIYKKAQAESVSGLRSIAETYNDEWQKAEPQTEDARTALVQRVAHQFHLLDEDESVSSSFWEVSSPIFFYVLPTAEKNLMARNAQCSREIQMMASSIPKPVQTSEVESHVETPVANTQIPLPPKPTEEREIERHCVGVTVREIQIAKLILNEPNVNPQLRQIYEHRKEDAESFAALLGLMGAKEHEIDERETGAVAMQFGVKKANDDNVYFTSPAQEKPDQNEEMLWTRLQWCEAHMTR